MHYIVLRGMLIAAAGCLALLVAPAATAVTEQQHAADNGLPEMVVEAENQVRQDIHKSAFDFPLSAAVIDTFYTLSDQRVLSVSPVQGLVPFLNNMVPLTSEQVPHCWLPDPATTPVATFFPEDPEGHKARSWALTVTDYRGSTFRTFGKKGEPPRKVEWNGRGDAGGMMQAGYPYSYVFSVTDKGTNTYNYAGTSFRIPAIDYMEEKERRLDFSGDEIFVRNKASLSSDGRDWLVRAADTMRRDHPYSPLKVVVQAESGPLAEKRAVEVAGFLAEQMVLAEGWIETDSQTRPDLRSEMDGLVSVQAVHAER